MVPFLILCEDLFSYPIFIDQYLDYKWCLISCPIRDNKESYSYWSVNPSSGLYLTGIGKPFLDALTNVNRFRAIGFNQKILSLT